MAAIIGKTGVNSAQQTGKVAVNEKTNKVKEKYTITPKQFVGGLLAGAVAFGGIAYAIKKKPAKITELLEQAKNLGSKNSDEVKKVNKFKKENLKTLDNLGVKFNKGVAEVDGQKFNGTIQLYTKKGYPIDAYYENGILTGKLNKATGEHTFINKSHIKIKKKGVHYWNGKVRLFYLSSLFKSFICSLIYWYFFISLIRVCSNSCFK